MEQLVLKVPTSCADDRQDEGWVRDRVCLSITARSVPYPEITMSPRARKALLNLAALVAVILATGAPQKWH